MRGLYGSRAAGPSARLDRVHRRGAGSRRRRPPGRDAGGPVADAARDTLEAFRARGTEGSLDMGFAELPATLVAGILNLELLVHAWDLATATGQKLVVSPVLTDYVLGLARVTIGPQARGTAFAAEVLVDESAASLERLIGFTGREVAGI
ncbi:TIGR03086 family metal-binding protein [Arthrobacter oryzae]|uniref:TIGR03086 family metal-binding protein n=1 Tax=Arthrobacter oryzae TaxID=409290 RepID=UPI0037C0206B